MKEPSAARNSSTVERHRGIAAPARRDRLHLALEITRVLRVRSGMRAGLGGGGTGTGSGTGTEVVANASISG